MLLQQKEIVFSVFQMTVKNVWNTIHWQYWIAKTTQDSIFNNRYAYETLIEVVDTVGIKKVEALGLKHLGLDFITKTKDDFYNRHELSDGYLITTHSATIKKKQQLEEISTKLQLGLKVEVV